MRKLFRAIRLLFSSPRRFISRLIYEILAPTNWFTSAMRKFYCMFVPNKAALTEGNPDRFLFVYDTLCNPVTFDFLHYLYYADWMRRQACKTHIDILLVFRSNMAIFHDPNYMAAISEDNINWRLINLIVPLTKLFSSVGRIYIVDKEEAFEIVKKYASVHPEGYNYACPKTAAVQLNLPSLNYLPVLTICDTAQKIVNAYFPVADVRRIVTITLRTYDYILCRNSDIASWVEFASELDPLKYRVIFIPDASVHGIATFEKLNNFEIFDSACWNIELRAALYQRAWMNMGVACGPLAISGLMEKVLTVMIDRSLDYPADYLKSILSNGLLPGKPPNFYSSSCHFYLGKDNKETILKIFNEYAK